MTTIDERLNLVLQRAFLYGFEVGELHPSNPKYEPNREIEDIKSLFLDLIAEAKPAAYRHEGNASNLTANNTGLDTVSYMLDDYENNLKKLIDGGSNG